MGRLSWQVLQEFYANATRKLGVSPERARLEVEDLTQWNPIGPSLGGLQRTWHWCDQAQLNFWDAMIVASAEQAGCQWLLSEDFQAGQRFGTVVVVNPFERPPSEFGFSIRDSA